MITFRLGDVQQRVMRDMIQLFEGKLKRIDIDIGLQTMPKTITVEELEICDQCLGNFATISFGCCGHVECDKCARNTHGGSPWKCGHHYQNWHEQIEPKNVVRLICKDIKKKIDVPWDLRLEHLHRNTILNNVKSLEELGYKVENVTKQFDGKLFGVHEKLIRITKNNNENLFTFETCTIVKFLMKEYGYNYNNFIALIKDDRLSYARISEKAYNIRNKNLNIDPINIMPYVKKKEFTEGNYIPIYICRPYNGSYRIRFESKRSNYFHDMIMDYSPYVLDDIYILIVNDNSDYNYLPENFAITDVTLSPEDFDDIVDSQMKQNI